MAKSIEEQIEDLAKSWLSKDKSIKYYTKTESINHEIEEALKQAPSKNGGKGMNFPDIKLFIETKKMRKIPVMIEVKGIKGSFIKENANGEIDNLTKDNKPNYTNINKFAVNGESKLKTVYTNVKNNIMPIFTSAKHLDFTGKLFNVLNEWVDIPDSDKNDVVLTPRYVTELMAKLCMVNKDSYVWDFATGVRVIIVLVVKSLIKSRVLVLLQNIKTLKINNLCFV